VRTLLELKPVLPAPQPGRLPYRGSTPGGCSTRRGRINRGGSSRALSSKVGRSPFGGAGSVCAHADVAQKPASAAPRSTAKRSGERRCTCDTLQAGGAACLWLMDVKRVWLMPG